MFCFSSVQAAAHTPPVELIKTLSSKVLEELNDPKVQTEIKASDKAIYRIIDNILIPHTDFEQMARRVLKRHWKMASQEQRKKFQDELQSLVVRTYSTALKDYKEQRIEFPSDVPRYNAKKNMAEVRSAIKETGKTDTPVNYRLLLKEGRWKVYDIIIEGVSMVNIYHTEYSEDISSQGLDAVIEKMVRIRKTKEGS